MAGSIDVVHLGPNKEIISTQASVSRAGLCGTSSWRRLEERWNEMQVGRQGSYSVERLESLHHYCSTTSRARVIMVCVLTPLPGLMAASLLECLPLRPPSEGWAANWMFWFRFSLMVSSLIFFGIDAFNQFVPNFGLTTRRRMIVSVGTTIGYVGTCLGVVATEIVGFPIPFIWQGGGLLVGIFIPVMLLLVFGKEPFSSDSPFHPHIRRYVRLLAAYMSLGAVFPLYKLLYESVPETYQSGVVIVLPVWKFAAKHFMMEASRELEDYIPVIVALTVDFFSALFVSVCISTSGSMLLSVLLIAVDLGQVLLEFHEVRDNSKTVLELLRDLPPSQHDGQDSKRSPNSPEDTYLLTKIMAVTRNPAAFDIVSLKRTRLWACLPHPISSEQSDLLNTLEASAVYGPRGLVSRRKGRRRSRAHRSLRLPALKNTSIVPAPITKGKSKTKLRSEGSTCTNVIGSAQGEESRELVTQGLQLLFHCEYLALVEYVECVIPLVFALNKLILEELPNVAYYPGGAGKWGISALASVFVYATLEICTLFILNHFLQRKFSFSPLYQLAFALESSTHFVQGALFLEIVGLLQYELLHLGADFTFRFEWLRDNDG